MYNTPLNPLFQGDKKFKKYDQKSEIFYSFHRIAFIVKTAEFIFSDVLLIQEEKQFCGQIKIK